MAGLFDQGKATGVTTPGALSPADVAGKIFAIKLLLSRLGQGGGAPQTFGDYIKSGPRKIPSSVTSEGGNALMAALQQPGAFNRGPTTQVYSPSSPSLFQDAAGLIPLLSMLNQIGSGGTSGPSVMEQIMAHALKIDPSTLKEPTTGPTLLGRLLGGSGGGMSAGSGATEGGSLGADSNSLLPLLQSAISSGSTGNNFSLGMSGANNDYNLPTLSQDDYSL